MATKPRQSPATPAPITCCAPLGSPSLTDEETTATAALFKALADPHRVRIVNLLATSRAPACVCDLTERLCLTQPTVSHHLKKLVTVGLLDREQRGIWAYYSLNHDTMRRLGQVVALNSDQGASR